MKLDLLLRCLVSATLLVLSAPRADAEPVQDCPSLAPEPGAPTWRGARPADLLATLEPGSLEARLRACLAGPPGPASRTVGHRGAPLRYPEHTRESYLAAARQGATTLECDVAITRDGDLVCRHDACDLHRTTNVLQTPLAAQCHAPFRPAVLDADGALSIPASARCCTTDFDLQQLLTLQGRQDAVDPAAQSVDAYLDANPNADPDADPDANQLPCLERGSLLSHAQSIDLFAQLGVAMTPELKPLPDHLGAPPLGLLDAADQLLDDYRAAGIDPARVWPQSFDPAVVRHWLATASDFRAQVIWLDGRYRESGFNHRDTDRLEPGFRELAAAGLVTVAPPFWMLLEWEPGPDGSPRLGASNYARAARSAGLALVTWTLDRSGSLAGGGGWYYQTLNGMNPGQDPASAGAIDSDGDQLRVLDALFHTVGVQALFSDWPATAAFVDRCPPEGWAD